MAGISLQEQNLSHTHTHTHTHTAVKKPIFPFTKFKNVDPILGPEMRSTGEVMGIAKTLGQAFLKAELSANSQLPSIGTVFISVRDADKSRAVLIAKKFSALGFHLIATSGTARAIISANIACDVVNKVEAGRPHIVDRICNGDVQLVINTTEGEKAISDSFTIRRSAVERGICYTTTLAGADAVCMAIEARDMGDVVCLQEQ